MKLILFLSALLLLSTLSAKAANDAVLDTDGNNLLRGVDYYILPAFTDVAGGFHLASRPNQTCPEYRQYVAEENSPADPGLPLTFSPVDPNETIIREQTDQNIVFSAITICIQSTQWQLGEVDEITGRIYVKTGGDTGNPGSETLSNWFKIERYESDYKLVFCPTVCDTCRPVCGNLGVIIEDGTRWFGLSDLPLPVRFMKA